MMNSTASLDSMPQSYSTSDRSETVEPLTLKEWIQTLLWAGAMISIGLGGILAALIESA